MSPSLDHDPKRTKYNRKDVVFTVAFLSLPLLSAFLLLFTFVSGPGAKYWTVIVDTEACGLVKVGALGICSENGACRGSGLNYNAGETLGSVIPQFTKASIFHLVVFLLILLVAALQAFYCLPKMHTHREQTLRRSHLVWLCPAFSAFLLVICIIMDWALIIGLRKDPILRKSKTGTPDPSAVRVCGSVYPILRKSKTCTPDPSAVRVCGSVYLTCASLTFACIWLTISLVRWKKSPKEFQAREKIEKQAWDREYEERGKRSKEPGGFAWFQPKKETGSGGDSPQMKQGGRGLLAGLRGNNNQDAAPTGLKDYL